MLTIMRIWALDHNVIPDQSDIEFCINNGIELDIQQAETQRIETGNGRVYHYRSSPGVIKLTTFDDKAEVMLQLRYGDKVRLMNQIYTESVTQ